MVALGIAHVEFADRGEYREAARAAIRRGECGKTRPFFGSRARSKIEPPAGVLSARFPTELPGTVS
jgi:hypothetical protein